MKTFFYLLCVCVGLPVGARDLAGVRERQQRVGAEVSSVALRVRALAGQLEAAGAPADDLRLYLATAEILERLATDDVSAILGALEKLHRASTPDAVRVAALDAYGRQQSVASQLQLLGIEHEQRLRLQVLAAVYTELAERQTSARRAVSNALRRIRAGGVGPDGAMHDLLVRDQAALTDDLRRVGGVFGQSAQLAGGDGLFLFQRAAAELAATPPENAADAARTALAARRWEEALFAQNASRVAARRVARLLRPDASSGEAREDAVRALRTLALTQTNLPASAGSGDRFAAGDQQADLADAVVSFSPEVAALSPEAGAEVRLAFAAMAQAVALLDQGADASERQRAALDSLERAIRFLEERVFTPPPPPERMQELAQQARRLASEQMEQVRRPDAERQREILMRAEDLTVQAASASVEAARELAEAAEAMRRTEAAAEERTGTEAREAAAALERAARRLAQQAEQRMQAEARQQGLAEFRRLLDEAAAAVAEARGRQAEQLAEESSGSTAESTPPVPTGPDSEERRSSAIARARNALEEVQRRQLTAQLPYSARLPVAEARASVEAAQREPSNSEPRLAQAQAALEQARAALDLAELGFRADARARGRDEAQREAEARAREALQNRFVLGSTHAERNEAENSGDAYDGANQLGPLSPRDRDALTQARRETVAEEFAPRVEAYLRNLAGEPRP